MFPSLLLSLREGLEAALIIGIVLGVLNRLNQPHLKPVVWQGAAAAIVAAVLVGIGLNLLGMEFEGKAEEIFEGLATLFAAGVLTWMILWMQKQGKHLKANLESETSQALSSGKRALFTLAFIAVFREGLELAIFLLATSFVAEGSLTLIGAAIGLVSAVILGWILFSSTRRLSLRGFFQVTNILLILFAAGLVAYGVHELNEAGWIPSIIEHVWDINHIFNEKSQLGLIFKALFGYNGNPSLTEVMAYVSYFVILSINYIRFQRRDMAELPTPA
ncbi:MAG: FTR1 family protein [Anaerolineales bacterium]|nr:FTR1 family protein [Anaerolineales bacterium]